MKKGLHPQMQWISYVTQSCRLINVMMSKIHGEPNVSHFRAKRQMAKGLGQIAKFKRHYDLEKKDEVNKEEKWDLRLLVDFILVVKSVC
ncbi:50S ribosomal protein L31 [Bienertia sinuspersici]